MRYFVIILMLAVSAVAQDAIDDNETKLLSNAFIGGGAPGKVKGWFVANTGPGKYWATPTEGRAAMRSFYRALVPRPNNVSTRKMDAESDRNVMRLKGLPKDKIVGTLNGKDVTVAEMEAIYVSGNVTRAQGRAANEAAHATAVQAIQDAKTALDAAQAALAEDGVNPTLAQAVDDAQAALDSAQTELDELPQLE